MSSSHDSKSKENNEENLNKIVKKYFKFHKVKEIND